MNRKLYDLTNPQMNIWATEQYYNNTAVNNVGGTVLLKAKLIVCFSETAKSCCQCSEKK